jgi:DNA-binding MarR family transcriptional regulator
MVRLSRQLRRMDPSELTITQFSGLAAVVRCGPLGVGQLAEIEGLPSPAATRLADKLEQAGFLSRQAHPTDRRGVQLVATAKGKHLLTRREQVGNAWLAEHLSALSKVDRLAIERAVTILESFATEHSWDAQGAATYKNMETKAEARS